MTLKYRKHIWNTAY